MLKHLQHEKHSTALLQPLLRYFRPMQKKWLAWWVVLLGGCAIVSTPEGGPKDNVAPQIIETSPPNKSVNFSAKTIVITFDEFVQVSNFSSQFFSSPPLTKRIDQRLKGKSLYLTLNEDLRPNTTYTFSFGNALQDITENNTQTGFKYVFATGPVLDSLMIKGSATDAFTGLPEEGAIAMLFPATLPDSLLPKTRPNYYAISDKSGAFAIENLAADSFRMVVIKDDNQNLKYDEATEKGGFVETPIVPGGAIIAPVRLYKANAEASFVEGGHKGYGRVQLAFTRPVPTLNAQIAGAEVVNGKRETTLIEPLNDGDTVLFWYNPREFPQGQNFLFLNLEANGFQEDSARILLTKMQPEDFKITAKGSGKPGPMDTLKVESSVPILSVDEGLIRVMHDSLSVPYILTQTGPRNLAFYFKKTPGSTYQVTFLKDAITDLFGRTSDSTAVKTTVATDAEKAIAKLRITASDTHPKIFQFLSGSKTMLQRSFVDAMNMDLDYVEPGKYGIRIIWDDNQNGRWDVGEFSLRQQPERVLYYPQPIELRANWELEVVWQIPEP